MPSRKIYLGKIRNSSPLMEKIANRPVLEKKKPMEVNLEGEWKGTLQLDSRRANVWAKILDHLQRTNRPVYVEIDNDTNIITKLYVPFATKVIDINISDENVVYVVFNKSHARHYLRRNLPEFEIFLNALQNAKATDTEVLVTSIRHEFEIIDVRPVPPSFGIDGPPEPPPPIPPDPPVSPQRAIDLFNLMKADTCTPCSATSPCIPFNYPYDGCWIRAHLMCYKMIAEGETPEKIWIGLGNLEAATSNMPNCKVNWGWHVAPTLMVTQSGGPDIKMVIDPSLCEGPVTPEVWRDLQGPTETLTPSAWTGYNFLASGTATQTQAELDMEDYRNDLDDLCAAYGPSPYSCPIVKKCFFIVDRSTISKDEVDAMLVISNPGNIESAFYVVVEGFTPSELGITNATLSGVPDIQPVFNSAPAIAGMTMAVTPTIKLEDPFHLIRPQRITWKYKISFTSSAGFVNELEEINLSASITSISGTITTVSSTGKIYLIKQPNPYEIDGEVSWLSTDLRVFQINAGQSKFNKMMGNDPSNFITDVIQNLNTGNTAGQTFENNISTDQQTSRLELSQLVNGVAVYNFAVAKVRYRAVVIPATTVRVFFRLFPASSTSLEFNQSTTYRRNPGGNVIPLLGIIGGEAVTFPCFAAPRINSAMDPMTTQPDPANVQTIPPNAGGNEIVRYFGCWLDINQTQPQFPVNPSPLDGPWGSGRQSVQEHVRNEHQCLVAEIAFDPTPIPPSAYPSTSDKLAQRNLAIVQSANPGDFASHRVPHTFEIKPTRINREAEDELPDELMIDWGNTPVGCLATLYISGVNTNEIMELAAKNYHTHGLLRIDAQTLQCETGGMTYIPIPRGEGSNFPAMLTIDLPAGVKKGQVFTVVVHQVTNAVRREILTHAHEPGASLFSHRRVHGSFQITIPVTTKENMLVHEEVLLSNLRWIHRAIPANNRWFPVFTRYVKQIANRVNALGGNSDKVAASPSDDWKARYRKCMSLRIIVAILLAALVIASGSLSGSLLTTVVPIIAIIFISVLYYWLKQCKPGTCSLLKTFLFGVGAGAIGLLLLLLFGVTSVQLVGVLIGSVVIAILFAIMCWIRGCFKSS